MTYELTAEEKISIIDQHLRNLEYKKYNLDLSLIEEQSLSAPSTARLAEINAALDQVLAQKGALTLELESLA
jgi:hypothetical protein